MKYTAAVILVVVSMVAAEVPRFGGGLARQTAPAAPYVARGWRPAGQQLNLPLRAQPQQVYGAPQPRPTYGPPPPTEGPEVVTTEEFTRETTTEGSQFENIETDNKPKPKSEKLEEPKGQFYVLLPQGQSLLYSAPRSAPLVAVPAAPSRANLMAAPVQAIPLTGALTSSLFTPFSGPYVQIYQ